ncbi:DUF397 domain-containing protein [Actinomadura sp. DC4]|nr:DUF397 domain-containing protein [Actinomadura sp. DC4]MDN3353591.1 DUF397 domain-containing protein [Actinomadura sp. DC4]
MSQQIQPSTWRKSTHSGGGSGDCVEVTVFDEAQSA